MFFARWYGFVLGIPAIPFLWKRIEGGRTEKRRELLRKQFRDFLYSVSSLAAAGKSLEASLTDTAEALSIQYGAKEPVMRFAERIRGEIVSSETPVTDILAQTAGETNVKEIRMFGDICRICVETGGNLPAALNKTGNLLSERIESELGIASRLAEKKLEFRILLILPLGILGFLRLTSADYMSVLYETAAGRILMLFALAGMAEAYLWSERMIDAIFR